ncbi:BRCT domain-containing protein [Enterococcus avium]|uniref:BRCT domain-containing protein n=1 Tax=Enterococcus TaxID=1350 RepID=UPI00298D67B0|nr:BRCT domain-containing protein [Enterococcus avium]
MRNVPFKNKTVVFTGTLQTLTRKQAQRLVYSLHGHCQSSVTKQTRNKPICSFVVTTQNHY